MIREAIKKVVNKGDLSYSEAYEAMGQIMRGESSAVQNAAFLAALSTKSTKHETIDEILGCAAAMREAALPFDKTGIFGENPNLTFDKNGKNGVNFTNGVLDIVGTGGDGSNTFNISTTSAFVLASGGVKVAKHGNRAASSKCGTADCLEALGLNLDLSPKESRELLARTGFCFLFAQKYHPAMRFVGGVRKELGFRTVFNILGVLSNPARPEFMVLGVYDESLVRPLAEVLVRLGVKRGFVVFGRDGLDELSLLGETAVCEFGRGEMREFVVTPEKFGLKRCTKAELLGGDAATNANILREILAGKSGTKADAVALNAGAGFYISGVSESFEAGVGVASEILRSGRALCVLEGTSKKPFK